MADLPEITYKPQLPENPRPIVILGAGGIVRDAHLPAYRSAGFTVSTLYNRTVERARSLAADFGVPNVVGSVAEAVASAPEGAVFDIALMTPQFIPTLEQLPKGAAVLIQKPMGDSLEEAQAILEVCRRRNLTAAINTQLRFAPYVSAARDLLEQGHLGELYDIEVRLAVETPWGLFPNVMHHPRLEIAQHSVHYIDMIRSFLGNPTTVKAATVGHPAKELSSSRSTIILGYGDKIRATISTNHDHEFGRENQESFIKLEGTKGAVKARMGLLMDYPDGVPDKFEYCLRSEDDSPVWHTKELEGSWFPDAFVGSMAVLMRYAEGSSATLPTSVEDVVATMAVVEAAYESNATGGVRPDFN